MTERDPERLRQAVAEAAEMVRDLPEALQVAAFNKVFDAMIGAAPPAPVTAISPAVQVKGPGSRVTRASTPISADAVSDVVERLVSEMNRTDHPGIRSGRQALDLALMVLQAAEQHGVEWLTPGQICRVLRDKFRVTIADSSIRMALGRAGREVDRRPAGPGYEYRIMEDGENYLENLSNASEDDGGAAPQRGATPKRGRPSARKGAHPRRNEPTTNAEGNSDVPESDENGDSVPSPSREGNGGRRGRGRAGANGRVGPKRALEDLLEAGYFDEPRSMGAMIEHLQHRRALTFTSSDMGPTLIRLVREGKLQRLRNAENQYEYSRPE